MPEEPLSARIEGVAGGSLVCQLLITVGLVEFLSARIEGVAGVPLACQLLITVWACRLSLSTRIEGVAGVPLVCQLLITVCMLVQYGCLMNPSLLG